MAATYSTIAVATDTGSEVQSKIANGAAGTLFSSGGTGSVPTFTATPSVTSITVGGGTALGTFVQNTYSPVLAFGGASVGITYNTQSGQYIQIGNTVFFTAYINISSKGSSTGSATLSLPVNSGGNLTSISPGYWSNITLTALYINLNGYIQSNVLNLAQSASGQSATPLTDVNMGVNSIVIFSGFYFIS